MTLSIAPHDLGTLLDRYPQATCLSLDCFDTLIWRDVHAPVDLFAAMPHASRAQRVAAETVARKARDLAGKGTEVSVEQIHARLMPNADAKAHAASIAEELRAEATHCYAFAPVVDLMRQARARGMQVVIVSDTYLDAAQLRSLIVSAGGQEVAGLIDQIFCSSHFGLSKGGGLYGKVLPKLRHKPEQIVHLGDNFHADVEGVAPFGVQAVHLAQFLDQTRQRLRLEAAVDAVLHPHRPATPRGLQPHRAALAVAEPQLAGEAQSLGAGVLGPVLFAFEQWLQAEAAVLSEAHGAKVHWLFLMRDGYLPQRVHDQGGVEHGHALEISRFTATAAHFVNEKSITAFVEEEIGLRPATLARQMLLPEARIAHYAELSMEEGSQALLKESRTGTFRKSLLRQSRSFAERLCKHVQAMCNPQVGDVLMLVDLGYNGTVQNRIAGVLETMLGVHVSGRYLVLREKEVTGLDKRGLIDNRHYAPEVLEGFCANVALLEQLCTKAQGSVVDYTAEGTPLRGPNDIKQQQSKVREAVQEGCLAYQRSAAAAVVRKTCPDEDTGLWRKAAASVLARAMFLPLAQELSVVEAFEHDVNMGTAQTVPLFDRAIARAGLRQRGLFYMNGAERMLLPAEIDGEGLPTRLALMVNRLFDPPFAYADFGGEGLDLPVTFIDAASGTVARRAITAAPTHDGWHTATIPVGEARFHVSVDLGEVCEWLELDRAEFVPVADFVSGKHESLRREWPATPLAQGAIEKAADQLWHCTGADGQWLIPPPEDSGPVPLLLALTFRPLVRRTASSQSTATERACA